MSKVLMKGNEAIGAAAIKAGCKAFFGYPITPQNEIPEYMSREMAKSGGVFVQAESELAAINMVYGAAGAGVRVMTSSSSPGIALKQEGNHLHCRRGTALCDCRRQPRGSWTGQHSTFPGRLFYRNPGRRQW
jgi:pyruvate/2-oxoacid:ferredoxin oxidoreductase alpha subunit